MLRGAMVLVAAAVSLTGCKKKGEDKPEPAPASEPEPVEVSFGDCAPATARFVSGPRPRPFDPAELERPEAGKRGRLVKTDGDGPEYELRKGSLDPRTAREEAVAKAKDSGIIGLLKESETGAFSTLGGEVGEMEAGFGLAGADSTSSGGGGTGWGTIGSGRYGTIGHGAGTGVGGGPRRRAAVPELRIGNASVVGDLDKNIIRRFIRRSLPRLRHCYERRLIEQPDLAGTVVTQFVIEAGGTVAAVKTSGANDEALARCVGRVIEQIQFPEPRGGSLVNVRYPFTFRPPKGVGAMKKEVADGSDPKVEKEAETEPEAKSDAKLEKEAGPDATSGRYRPGKDNPLREESEALEACFREQQAREYAAVVVEMTVGSGGAVSEVSAHGAPGGSGDCIAEVAGALRWQTEPGTFRCSLAFGSMPLEEAPGLAITASEIALAGGERRVVARTAEVAEDTSLAFKIPALYDALRERRARESQDVVAITGPAILRPDPGVPMKVVRRVLMTGAAAEVGYVLAARSGKEWSLLPHRRAPSSLPVVPVPRGTGGPWYRSAGGVVALTRSAGPPPAQASVLVATDGVWVGVSRVDDVRRIPKTGGGHDWEAFVEALAEIGETDAMKGRRDIELAAADDVPYEIFAELVRRTAKAGFDDWAVLGPHSLTVRFER